MPMMHNAHALVVGIANYEAVNRLPASVLNDAQDIARLLCDPSICGYPPENVRLLLDASATRQAILAALNELARRCDAEATVLIYFSGHGGRVESGAQIGEYLLPVDTSYASVAQLAQTAIAGAAFAAAVKALPAQRVVVILDCCHASGIGLLKSTGQPDFKQGLPESYFDALKQGRGRVILASSRSTEASYVMPAARNSLFTQHLLAGMQGGIASDDGMIRIFDLFEYIQPRVTGDQPHQHPIFKAEVEENFAVALYQGGAKGVTPVDADDLRYDAYISYVDAEPDANWVWATLAPRLEAAGLCIAVSGDVEDPGVARVVNIERGIRQSKRTLIVLSERYLADTMAGFENVLAQTMGIQEGRHRLLPVQIEPIDAGRLPVRLSMLTTLNLAHPQRAEREFNRLIQALKHPLPASP